MAQQAVEALGQARESLRQRNARLAAEWAAVRSGLQALEDRLWELWNAFSLEPGEPSLSALGQVLEHGAAPMLSEVLQSLERLRPGERLLEALQAAREGIDAVCLALPEVADLSGLEPPGGTRGVLLWRRPYGAVRRRGKQYPVRDVLRRHLLEETLARAGLDGEALLWCAQSIAALLTPWQLLRDQMLRAWIGLPSEAAGLDRARQEWRRQRERRQAAGQTITQRYSLWLERFDQRLMARLARSPGRPSPKRVAVLADRWQKNFGFWSRQLRAVRIFWDLERRLVETWRQSAALAGEALEWVEREHLDLLEETSEVIRWLEQAAALPEDREFPQPRAYVASAETRTARWAQLLEDLFNERLPETIEWLEPRQTLPRRRRRPRQLAVRQAFLHALASTRPWFQQAFQEIEQSHRALVRELERARQVVDFGRELARSGEVQGRQMLEEALSNARSLILHQQAETRDPKPELDCRLLRGLAQTLFDGAVALEKGRLGLWGYLARRRLSEGLAEVARSLEERLRKAVAALYRQAVDWRARVLIAIGLEPPPPAARQAVTQRGEVSRYLPLEWGAHDLPLLYRRLFRLAPVEDPRFLVGREVEMRALGEVRQAWREGRAPAVVVVGERGSGKTSLLNCAVAAWFADDTVVRGEFRERLTTAEQMRSFLGHLLGAPPDRLAEFLNVQPRVVILEEVERAFLRRIGGFEALRDLLSLISATARSVLWIVSINYHSWRYLDAAVGFQNHFSHKLDAVSVAPDQLKAAVLLRHNLSGLRLHFAPPPAGDRAGHRLRRVLGLEKSREERFFEALFRQSEGVFRAAFELWMNLTERVEAGVLHLRFPVEAPLEPLYREASLEELLCLQAILHHGSLTSEEHAQVFSWNPTASRILLEQLQAKGYLEPEPEAPGLRIRPEAGRLVRQLLHRHNLI